MLSSQVRWSVRKFNYNRNCLKSGVVWCGSRSMDLKKSAGFPGAPQYQLYTYTDGFSIAAPNPNMRSCCSTDRERERGRESERGGEGRGGNGNREEREVVEGGRVRNNKIYIRAGATRASVWATLLQLAQEDVSVLPRCSRPPVDLDPNTGLSDNRSASQHCCRSL